MITPTTRKRLLWVSMAKMAFSDINQEAVSTLYYKFKWQIITSLVSIFQTAHTQKRPDACSQQKLGRPLAAFKMQNEKVIIVSNYQQEVLQHKRREYNTVQAKKLFNRIKQSEIRGSRRTHQTVILGSFQALKTKIRKTKLHWSLTFFRFCSLQEHCILYVL